MKQTKGKSERRWLRWSAAALLGALLLSGCQEAQQTLTIGDLSSRYNREMWWLSIWAISLSVIIFVGVSAALFYTVHKFREDRNDEEPQQLHGNNALEVVLVGVPVLIVLGLSVGSVMTMAKTNPVMHEGGPNVEALAKQFWWNFTYTDEESDAGGLVANGNEMVMPTEVDTVVTLLSGDVVHEFWAPNVGPQRQAIPGSEKVWPLHTDRPAVYQGNCNYLCGASHANMRYKVVALAPEDYNTFITAAKEYVAPEPAPNTPEARGYELFMNGKPETGATSCAACHRVQGTPAASPVGPDLSFFGSRHTLGAGMWENHSPEGWNEKEAKKLLVKWIRESPRVKPGSLMPPYDGESYKKDGKMVPADSVGYLSEEEAGDIAAYLASLKLPAEADYWEMAETFNVPSMLPSGDDTGTRTGGEE